MGRGGEQPALQSRAVHAEESHAAADSETQCVNEEPDLELGLLPDQNADSMSALHTHEAGQSIVHTNRSVISWLPRILIYPVLCAANDCRGTNKYASSTVSLLVQSGSLEIWLQACWVIVEQLHQ